MAAISQAIFDQNFSEIYCLWSNWQQPRTGLDNGLATNRRQAIIWTNADPIHWRIYAAPGGRWVKSYMHIYKPVIDYMLSVHISPLCWKRCIYIYPYVSSVKVLCLFMRYFACSYFSSRVLYDSARVFTYIIYFIRKDKMKRFNES